MSHPQYNPYLPGNKNSTQRPFGNPSLQDTGMATSHTVSKLGFSSSGPSTVTTPNAEGRVPPQMSQVVTYGSEQSQPSADKNTERSMDIPPNRPRENARFPHNLDYQSFGYSGPFNRTQKDEYLTSGTGTSSSVSSKVESNSNSLDWLLSLKKAPVSTNYAGSGDHRFNSPSQKDHDVISIPGLGDIEYEPSHKGPVAAETSTPKYSPESAGNILMRFGLEKEDFEYLVSFPEDQMTPSNLPYILHQISIEKAKRATVAVESKSYSESQPIGGPRRPDSLGSSAGPSAVLQPKVIDYGHTSKYVSEVVEGLGRSGHRGAVSSEIGTSLESYERSSQQQQPLPKDLPHFLSSSLGSSQSEVSPFPGSTPSYGSYRSDLIKKMQHQPNQTHQQHLETFVLPKTDTDRRTFSKPFPYTESADRQYTSENKPSYTEFRSSHGLAVAGHVDDTRNKQNYVRQFSQQNLGQVQQRQQNQQRLPQQNQQVEVQKNPMRALNQQGQMLQNQQSQQNLGQMQQRQQNQQRLPHQNQQVEVQKNPMRAPNQQGQMLQNQQVQQRQQNQPRLPQQNQQEGIQKNQPRLQNQQGQMLQNQQKHPAPQVKKEPPPLSSTKQPSPVAPLVPDAVSTRPSVGFRVGVPSSKPVLFQVNALESPAAPVKQAVSTLPVSKGLPTLVMMLDYAASTPNNFPHTCSLCSKEFRDMRGWISHQNNNLHLTNCRLLRTNYPYWDGKIVSEPSAAEKHFKHSSSTSGQKSHQHPKRTRNDSRSRSRSPRLSAAEKNPKGSSSTSGQKSQQHHRKNRDDSRSRSRSPRRRRRRSHSKSPRSSRYTRRSRSRSQERHKKRDERQSASRRSDNKKTSSTRSDDSRSSPKKSDKKMSSPRRSRERRQSSDGSAQPTQASGAEKLVKKLLQTTAAHSEEPNLEAMVKTLAPALLVELSKMKSSSSSSSTTTRKEKTSISTKSDKPEPATMVKLIGIPFSLAHSDLFNAMEKFGKTTAVVIYRSRLEATVRFEKVEDAEKVKSQKNVMVNGVEVTVEKKDSEREKKMPENKPAAVSASSSQRSESSRQSTVETTAPENKSQACSAKQTTAENANNVDKLDDSTKQTQETKKSVRETTGDEKLTKTTDAEFTTANVKEEKSEVTLSTTSDTPFDPETSDLSVQQESVLVTVKVKSESEPESATEQEKSPASPLKLGSPSAEVSPETVKSEVKPETFTEINPPAETQTLDLDQVQDPLAKDIKASTKISNESEIDENDQTSPSDVPTEPKMDYKNQLVSCEPLQLECENVIQSESLEKSPVLDSLEKINSCAEDQTKDNLEVSSQVLNEGGGSTPEKQSLENSTKKSDEKQEDTVLDSTLPVSSTSVEQDFVNQEEQKVMLLSKTPEVPKELNKPVDYVSEDNTEDQDIDTMDLDSFQILDSIDSTEDDNDEQSEVKPSDKEEDMYRIVDCLEDQSTSQKEPEANKQTSDVTNKQVTKVWSSPRTRSYRKKGESIKEDDKAATENKIQTKPSVEGPVESTSERSVRRTRGKKEDIHKASAKTSVDEPFSYKILDSVGDEPEEPMVMTRSTRERRGRTTTNDTAVEKTKKETTGTRRRRTPVREQQKKEEKTSKKSDITEKETKEVGEEGATRGILGSEENQVGKKDQPTTRGRRGRSRRDEKSITKETETQKIDASEVLAVEEKEQEEEPLYQILDSVEDDQVQEELTSTEGSTGETNKTGETKDVFSEKGTLLERTAAEESEGTEMDDQPYKIEHKSGTKTKAEGDNKHTMCEVSKETDKACPKEDTPEGCTSEDTVKDFEEEKDSSSAAEDSLLKNQASVDTEGGAIECSSNAAAQKQEMQLCKEEDGHPRKRQKVELAEVEDDNTAGEVAGLTDQVTAGEVQDLLTLEATGPNHRGNMEQSPEESQESELSVNVKTLTQVSKSELDVSSEENHTSATVDEAGGATEEGKTSEPPTETNSGSLGHGQKTSAEEQGEEQEPGFKEPASPVAPQNMFEVTAELGQQILEEWIEAAAEDLKPEDQNLEEFEAKQVKRKSEFDGLEAKKPRSESHCTSADTKLPAFTPNNPTGLEFVVPKSGFFCNLCRIFYLSERTAKEMHCSSKKHYDNLQKYYETFHLKAPESSKANLQ